MQVDRLYACDSVVIGIFKVTGIIVISKIELFNFSSTERVKQNQKKKNNSPSNTPKLVRQVQEMPSKAKYCFSFSKKL